MKKVMILACHNTMATTVFGPMDIFNQAGRLWGRVRNESQTPFFEVILASPDGNPVRCTNDVWINPHCSIKDAGKTDLIVISSATCIDQITQKHPELVPWLINQHEQGAHIASICTGVFLLAETGLLDHKTATLHWGFISGFKEKYPQISVTSDKMFIDHGDLYCSAGVTAGMDLSLYLVEKICGRQAAVQSAKTMILNMDRRIQTPYQSLAVTHKQTDPVVMKVQQWIEQNYKLTVDYDCLAKECRISRRSLERRFKRVTGITPLGYLQQLRVEKAKTLMEKGFHTFSEVTYLVGYEDISFFRKLFVRLTGVRPKEYQRCFSGYETASVLGQEAIPDDMIRV